jgi:hypothetical protein
MLQMTRIMKQGLDRIGITRLAAFVAALLLVLQSALAVAAQPVQRDIFGNVICAEGSTGHSPFGQGHDGGHMPDCCMLSCGMAFQGAADVPATVEWQTVVLAAEAVIYPPLRLVSPHDRRTPANPRAPPAA